MLKKLRIKFVCINMTIITIMLVFILCMIVQFTKQNLEQANVQMMEELAANPLYLIKPTDTIPIRLPYFSLRLNQRGELLESVSSAYDLSDRYFLDNLIHISYQLPGRTGVIPEYNLRFMRISTPTDQFMIFSDISNEITTIDNLTQTCVLIGIFSFFVFLWISIFFANWAIQPVDRAWTQQKQFIADASHELKTPLTVILTNAELLQNPNCRAESSGRLSENILIVARQMRGLVEGLLELSRIDNGDMKTVMEPLNWGTLAETSVCLFEPLYFEHGLQLIDEIDGDVKVRGSEMHLKQVVDILLDNALKYAAPQTEVRISMQKQRNHCTLTVSSHGDPISPEDLKQIFKRFYRTDQSRNQSGSYGLGLSIAESIVTEHHGKIWAQSEDGMNSFYVRLPLNS